MKKALDQYKNYAAWSKTVGYPVRSYNSFCHIRQFFSETYADQECATMTDKLREAEERIAEIKKVYYLINNGNLNQEGLTLYHAIGEIIFNRPTSLSQKFINQTAVPDSTEK